MPGKVPDFDSLVQRLIILGCPKATWKGTYGTVWNILDLEPSSLKGTHQGLMPL